MRTKRFMISTSTANPMQATQLFHSFFMNPRYSMIMKRILFITAVMVIAGSAVARAAELRTKGPDREMQKTADICGAETAANKYAKPPERELRKRLSPIQYKVTQENGTEQAFHNEYWNNKKEGIYVDVVSGEPLFSSRDKYDSGTGWPSFLKPLTHENVVEKTDRSFFVTRTEVRSRSSNSHLGHVFDDGPPPTGRRYCMNSAALRFIPKEDLEKEGYGEYLKLFTR